MSHFPKPFFKQARGVWYVEIARKQHNLGPDKEEAFRRYHALMAESPKERPQRVAPQSLDAIIDVFLEWVSCRRAADTYEQYRYRLERFAQRYPSLRIADLRPFHVETWVDSFKFSITSRRNYLRSVKRCLKWAKKQGYVNSNPIADLEVPAPDDAIRVLGLDRRGLSHPRESLRWLCRTGKVRFTKIGRYVRFREEWLREVVERNSVEIECKRGTRFLVEEWRDDV